MRSIEGGIRAAEGKKAFPNFFYGLTFFLQAMTMPPWLDLEKWNCTTTITSPTTIVLGQLYAVSQRKNPPKVALIWVIFQAAAMDHGVEIKHENLPTMNQMNKGEISRTIFQFFILSFIFKSNKKKYLLKKKG